MDKYDVAVIGAGVTGCAVAMYLCRSEVSVIVLEKEEDVCSGTSKANSGIVHAGYDARPGTLKARMNVRGSKLIEELSETLDFPYRNNGSLVLCFDEAGMPRLKELYDRGIKNGVDGIEILTGEQVRQKESAVSDEVIAALWAPTAGIVCPFGMTAAFAENAAANGAQFRFLEEVTGIVRDGEGGFVIRTDRGEFFARNVVNAAGVYADRFHNMMRSQKISITPRRGEYVLLDKQAGDLVSSTVFQLPGPYGKGVLVTPTVHGNLLVGPNAEDIEDKEDTTTTSEGMEDIKTKALRSVPGIPYNLTITSFAGLRAHGQDYDFILGEAEENPGFFEAAAISSPGLSSAPAIGEYIAGLVVSRNGYKPKTDYIGTRKGFTDVSRLSAEERSRLIREHPEYGRIVCRCENVTEGQILEAIRRTPGARSLDGIKRRVRQGMGRCQSGFCTPAAMKILSDELGIPMEKITKNRPGSELLRGDTDGVS
ncbi:MAG: NAD(P)/FAD-dependent oxidoreductase [Clostridiales bacterium]|nr:NAD(P)/FAD-dependent oxidoreductase [Clostridiales bacterium]